MSDAISSLLQHPGFAEGECWVLEDHASGALIIDEGDQSRDVFVVMSGTVRVNKRVDIEDDRHIQSGLSELSEGATFGELNLFDDSARSASVVAQTDVRLARIDGPSMEAFLDAHPDIGYPVLKAFFTRHATFLRSANQRVSGLFAWGLKRHDIVREL